MPENNPEVCEGITGGEQERCANRLLGAWTADMAFVLDRLEQLNALGRDERVHGASGHVARGSLWPLVRRRGGPAILSG
jgi:hypothetical protein